MTNLDSAQITLLLIQILKDSNEIPDDAILEEWEKIDLDSYFYRLQFSRGNRTYQSYIRLEPKICTKYFEK